MQPTSFWPSKFAERPQATPIALLEQQANLLSEYHPSLDGRVTTTYREGDSVATVALYVINKKLHGYNYRLLSFEQPMTADFPVTLVMHFKTKSPELGIAASAADFTELLKAGLSNDLTKAILDHLVTMGEVMQRHREDIE